MRTCRTLLTLAGCKESQDLRVDAWLCSLASSLDSVQRCCFDGSFSSRTSLGSLRFGILRDPAGKK